MRETCGDRSVRLLAPLLADKRTTGGVYSVNQDDSEPHLPVRVCDEAAETIAMHSKTLKFVMKGPHEKLDRQIESMLASIGKLNTSK